MVDLRRFTLLLICLLLSQPLFAHKLKVFATAEGERIVGQAYFVGGDGAGVVADSLDGHRAVWTLQADEFPSSLPRAEAAGSEPVPSVAGTVTESDATTVPTVPPQGVTEAALERAVARQIRPLREALQGYEEQVRLRDIIGGIGYIVGLAGLGLWWGRRRKDGR
ncbi:MAG: hypothetical protein P8098_19340 [Candidatus Thiodiazotropha sp.]